MDRKSVGLKILFFTEAVIAIRVLLFSIPVMINKFLANSFLLSNLKDCFIVVMTATALLYFIVGAISVVGYKRWKAVHYWAAIFTLAITLGSLGVVNQSSVPAGLFYFSPVLFSAVVVAFAWILGGTKQTI